MLFVEFAKRLHDVLGGENTGEFTRELFANITDFPDEMKDDNPVIDQSDQTFKSYFNGTRPIRAFTKKIIRYVEPELFKSYIGGMGDGTAENLVQKFEKDCPGINSYNVTEVLARLFENILLEISSSGKTLPVTNKGKGLLKDNMGIRLVIETDATCPNDWCSNSLQVDYGDRVDLIYEVLKIDESGAEEFENLLAVCPECASKIKQNHTAQMTNRLVEIKHRLMEIDRQSSILTSERLEKGVEKVLEKISIADEDELVPLNYNPVPVRQKIEKKYNPLYFKVKAYVIPYFDKVDDWLKQMDQDGRQHYRAFSNAMKINWLKLKMDDVSQPDAFEQLVNWLETNTHEDRMACEIVVSYFIQKCEVFDAITE